MSFKRVSYCTKLIDGSIPRALSLAVLCIRVRWSVKGGGRKQASHSFLLCYWQSALEGIMGIDREKRHQV